MLVTPGSPAAELSLLLFPLKENGEGGPTQTFCERPKVEQLGEQLCLPGHSPDHEHAWQERK
jgi:hypothetical protein